MGTGNPQSSRVFHEWIKGKDAYNQEEANQRFPMRGGLL